MAIICPTCNHRNLDDAKFCNQCGTKLNLPNDTTTNIVDDHQYDDLIETFEEISQHVTDLSDRGIGLALYMQGEDKLFELKGKSEFFLGRKTKGTPDQIDFDLEPFQGYAKGVSRIHAKITISGTLVTLTDLRSSNGTYLNQKRLMPNKSYTISHGDILSLGSLILQFHNYNQ